MKVIVDNKIPFIREAIGQIADEVVYLPGKAFTPEAVRDADALIIRTRTLCNRQLLDWQQIPARFYLRLRLSDPQQLAYISLLLDEYKLLSRPDQPKTEIALVTSTMTRRCLQEILAQLQAEGIVPLNTLFVLQ